MFLASIAAYVGLDPGKDIHWVTHPMAESMPLLAEGKVDALLGFPPIPQETPSEADRACGGQQWGRPTLVPGLLLHGYGNQEFVRKHPVATKRALRAIRKRRTSAPGSRTRRPGSWWTRAIRNWPPMPSR